MGLHTALSSVLIVTLAIFVSFATSQITEEITLVEGEILITQFLDLVLVNKDATLEYTQSVPGLIERTEYRPVRYRSIIKSGLLSESPSKAKFAQAQCFLDTKGIKDIINIVYTKQLNQSTGTDTTGHARYYIQQKETIYQRSVANPLDSTVKIMDMDSFDVASITVHSEFCIEPILVQEHKRILMVCSAAFNNQFFLVNICSDNSCSERSEPLKIKDFIKDVSFSLIRTKMMPGINEQTYALLVWFEGHPFIESILFDTSGNLESEVYRMDYPIWTVRYFSGQLLLFDTYINSEHIYLYSMFEFGFKRLDMGSIQVKQTKGFGTFINSFVNPVNGQVQVELLEDRMIVELRLDRGSQNFFLETTQAIFEPQEPTPKPEQLLVFEMGGDYQLVTIAAAGNAYAINKQAFSKFKILHRLDNFNDQREDYPFANLTTMWRKISGFNQLRGCIIEGNSSVGFNMSIIEIILEEPMLILNSTRILAASNSAPKLRMLESGENWFDAMASSEGLCSTGHKRTLQSSLPVPVAQQTINITRKTKASTEVVKTYVVKILRQSDLNAYTKWRTSTRDSIEVELLGMSSDQYVSIDRILKGNFICVHSYETSLNKKEQVGNKINPLLNYRTIWYTKGPNKLADDLASVDGFFAIMSVHKFKSVFQFITYRNQDQLISIYKTNGRDLILQRTETNKFKATYFELYNTSIAIIQGDQGLYVFDSAKASLRELLIDSGKCDQVLVGKHSMLDTIVWCFANSAVSAYYARDLVVGQAGIRKLTVVLSSAEQIDFKNAIVRSSEYLPDIIFVMGTRSNVLASFKVETKSSLALIEVSREKVGLPLAEVRTLDFSLLDQYLMVYQVQKVGYGDKILFEFYFVQSPMILIKTKSVALDYTFSPDLANPMLFPLAAKRLSQNTRQKYTSPPLFLLKVKVNSEFDNVLYINPAAPLSETIPHTALRLRSTVKKLQVGECLMIDETEIKLSAVLFYSFVDGGTVKHSLVKLDESAPQVFLGTDFDNSAEYTHSFVDPESESITRLNFEADPAAAGDWFASVQVQYKKGYQAAGAHQVTKLGEVRFNTDVRTVEMEGLRQLAVPEHATSVFDRTLYYLVELEGLVAGDVESWSMAAESQLEQSSQVIEIKGLIRNATDVAARPGQQASEAVIGTSLFNASCTKAYGGTRRVDFFGNDTAVAYDLSVCLGATDLVFVLDLFYGAIKYTLNSTRTNNLMITDPSLLGHLIEGDLLVLAVKSSPNSRNIYVDFYSLELTYRTAASAAFQTAWQTRRFFNDATKDFLLRQRQNSTNPSILYYEYFEFAVQKAVQSLYNTTVAWEHWNLRQHANRSFYLDVTPRREIRMAIPQVLYNGKSTMEVYDDVMVRLINHNDDTYIWMLFETMKYDSYIVRYSRQKIYNEPAGVLPYFSSLAPDVWRISNPYYGYDNLYMVRTRKVDWLFIQAKVVSDTTTRVLVYYMPPSIFASSPTQMDSIYVRQSVNISGVVDIRTQKIEGYQEPKLEDRVSETYKRVMFLRSNGSYLSSDLYPRPELHFSNLYIASTYITITAHGVRGKSDTKRFEIKASRLDTFSGKSELHGYLMILLIISIVIVFVIYQSLNSQRTAKKKPARSASLEKQAEDREVLLQSVHLDEKRL